MEAEGGSSNALVRLGQSRSKLIPCSQTLKEATMVTIDIPGAPQAPQEIQIPEELWGPEGEQKTAETPQQ